jgi:hypothetical protein
MCGWAGASYHPLGSAMAASCAVLTFSASNPLSAMLTGSRSRVPVGDKKDYVQWEDAQAGGQERVGRACIDGGHNINDNSEQSFTNSATSNIQGHGLHTEQAPARLPPKARDADWRKVIIEAVSMQSTGGRD